MDEQQNLDRVKKLAEERASIVADLESVTADLRRALIAAIGSGQLSEYAAHRLTGVSRTSIREWLGKKT